MAKIKLGMTENLSHFKNGCFFTKQPLLFIISFGCVRVDAKSFGRLGIFFFFLFPLIPPLKKRKTYTSFLKNIFQSHRPNDQTTKFKNVFRKTKQANSLYINKLFFLFIIYIYLRMFGFRLDAFGRLFLPFLDDFYKKSSIWSIWSVFWSDKTPFKI